MQAVRLRRRVVDGDKKRNAMLAVDLHFFHQPHVFHLAFAHQADEFFGNALHRIQRRQRPGVRRPVFVVARGADGKAQLAIVVGGGDGGDRQRIFTQLADDIAGEHLQIDFLAGGLALRSPQVDAVQLQPAPLVRTLQFSARVATLSRVDVGSTGVTAASARVCSPCSSNTSQSAIRARSKAGSALSAMSR